MEQPAEGRLEGADTQECSLGVVRVDMAHKSPGEENRGSRAIVWSVSVPLNKEGSKKRSHKKTDEPLSAWCSGEGRQQRSWRRGRCLGRDVGAMEEMAEYVCAPLTRAQHRAWGTVNFR